MNFTWQHFFESTYPLSDHVRNKFRKIWLRLHYPQAQADESESKIQSKLLSELLTECNISDAGQIYLPRDAGETESQDPFCPDGYHFFKTIPLHEIDKDDDKFFVHVFAKEINFDNEELVALTQKILDGSEYSVFILFKDSQVALHPYDSGVDIYSLDKKKLAHLKSHFQDFLSKRSDGL